MISSNVLDYKDLIIEKMCEEELLAYDDDPFWDERKKFITDQARYEIEDCFVKLPEEFQVEVIHWATTGRFLGKYRADGVSMIECYVFSGYSILDFWRFYTHFAKKCLINAVPPNHPTREGYKQGLIEPHFYRQMPGKRKILPSELEYILHARQLEYGFRDDPLPDICPLVPFDPVAEKERLLYLQAVKNGTEDGIEIDTVWDC